MKRRFYMMGDRVVQRLKNYGEKPKEALPVWLVGKLRLAS
jgi:hypothetical protein